MRHEEKVLASLHEAGHAVAILAQGGKVDRVTMDHCLEAEDSPLDRWHAAVVSMAGAEAARAHGPRYRSASRRPSEQDRAVALHHLEEAGIPRWRLVHAEEEARALVVRNGRSILRVAQALRQVGTLSGEQVARIHGGEPVAAVLAHRAAAPRRPIDAPTPHREATVTPTPHRVVVDGWELRAGGWCAAPALGQGQGLSHFEATGATRAEAEDRLRSLLSAKAGRPVTLLAG